VIPQVTARFIKEKKYDCHHGGSVIGLLLVWRGSSMICSSAAKNAEVNGVWRRKPTRRRYRRIFAFSPELIRYYGLEELRILSIR
jgi:hypothetical protein